MDSEQLFIRAMQVRSWVRRCENSLDFLFRDDTPDLGVVEALQGPPQLKICDPISGLDEPHVMKKVVSASLHIKILGYRVIFSNGSTKKSSKYGIGPTQSSSDVKVVNKQFQQKIQLVKQ